MKKVLVLIQNLLKNRLNISKPVSLSLKYFDLEYPSSNDEPQSIYVVVDKGIGAYLNQFKNIPTEEVIVVYDRALSGNLDEWLTNTIRSTWPEVIVSIELATNIQARVKQMDSKNLADEHTQSIQFTNSLNKKRQPVDQIEFDL